MDQKVRKIKNFTDLNAWKEGHSLTLEVYRLTKNFPREELFGLTNQLRRASVSFTSNIAEGFSRNSYKEKTQFYFMALGSLTEVQSQLMVARDLEYVSKNDFDKINLQAISINKITNGLIKKSKTMIRDS
jgi:four helix bundle protein